MILKSGSYKVILAVISAFCSCKNAIISISLISRSDSKFDKLMGPEKSTLAPSHTSAPAPACTLAEYILVLKYSKADLIKILKIFSKIKDQEPKAKVPYEQSLKAKVPDIYFEKLHINF